MIDTSRLLKRTSNRLAPDDSGPRKNQLLHALPAADFQRLTIDFEPVSLKLGQVLYEPGVQLRHVYFPTSSIVSLLYVMENGQSAELSVVGNEGLVGIALFLGGNSTPSRAVVQCGGHAYQMKARILKHEFARSGVTMHLLLRYTQALITQMAQTAACNRHHTVDQQFCRWLLLTLDRLPSNEIQMTQELLAAMLGVSRGGVSEAAGKLQAAGIISYQRGKIVALDRPALEARSCECYQVVKTEYDRLLPYLRNKSQDISL